MDVFIRDEYKQEAIKSWETLAPAKGIRALHPVEVLYDALL
ncbi:MAG: hypothetical protein ABIO55_01875 [Ginsengibacter sp.]